MESIIEYLKRPAAMRAYVMTHLYLACFHQSALSYYNSYCGSGVIESNQYKKPTARDCRDERLNAQLGSSSSFLEVSRRKNASGHGLVSGSIRWDWSGYPQIAKFFTAYKWFSSSMMIYFLIKNSMPGILTYFVSVVRQFLPLGQTRENRIPNECFLLGRFAVDSSPNLSNVTSALFSVYHLWWRFSGMFGFYRNHFDLFIMQTDRDIERFLQTRERHERNFSYLRVKLYHGSSRNEWSHMNSATNDDVSDQLSSITRQIGLDTGFIAQAAKQKNLASIRQPDDGLSGYEKLMRDVMFYKVNWRWDISYRLRLNRTHEAREVLKTRVAQNWILSVLFFIACSPPIIIYCLYCIIPDRGYSRRYPGCDPELEAMLTSGTLGKWSITPTTHRVLAIVADIIENFIVWADSGSALIFNTALGSILSQDLVICCERLQAKIEIYLERAQSVYEEKLPQSSLEASGQMDDGTEDLNLETRALAQLKCPTLSSSVQTRRSLESLPNVAVASRKKQRVELSKLSHPNMKTGNRKKRYYGERVYYSLETLSRVEWQLGKPSTGFDQAIFELQAEIKDFFDQITFADYFYSTFLTAYILIWFSARCMLSYYSLKVNKSSTPIAVHMLQVFNFCCMSFLSLNAFRLHGGCMKTCRLMCSLMAYDQSKYKKDFSKILDFYCNHKRCGFTLFHQYPYTPTTYLSIIGWSFSCFFVINSLLMHD